MNWLLFRQTIAVTYASSVLEPSLDRLVPTALSS